MYQNIIKPLFDFTAAAAGLVLLSPVWLLLLVVLTIANKGSPLFFQWRPGKDERVFCLVKFKTMTDERDASGELLPDRERLTNIGRFVRSTSLDEIPQLINVLRGEMSLVGPRPLLVRYLDRYNDIQRRRHEVMPGITGWAQVNGRNAISWEEKLAYDVWYVDHQSFLLDLRILWMTLRKVILRQDISQEGRATMEEFKG